VAAATRRCGSTRRRSSARCYRLIRRKDAQHRFKDGRGWSKDRGYGLVRDTLKALRTAFGSAWGDNKNHMVTRDVTIEAMLRLCGDVAAQIDATSCRARTS
jgi:hypothetical protein